MQLFILPLYWSHYLVFIMVLEKNSSSFMFFTMFSYVSTALFLLFANYIFSIKLFYFIHVHAYFLKKNTVCLSYNFYSLIYLPWFLYPWLFYLPFYPFLLHIKRCFLYSLHPWFISSYCHSLLITFLGNWHLYESLFLTVLCQWDTLFLLFAFLCIFFTNI